MEQDKTLSTPLDRVTVLDALRGFALLGVVLMHMLQHYSIFSFSGAEQPEPLFPVADEVIRWIGRNVISGRFINIFAFLFGLSFFIQMDRAARKGIDFRARFIWRMIILFVIGLIGNCFYSGEIMTIYAIFGIIMVFLYKVKSWVLMIIVALLLLGTPRILQTSYDKIVKTEQVENTTNRRDQRQTSRRSPPPEKPSFVNSVKHNFTRGLQGKLNYQFGMFGRGYITLALFVLGLMAGRIRFFEKVQSEKKRNLNLFIGSIIVVLLISWLNGLLVPQGSFGRPGTGDMPPVLFAMMSLNDMSTVAFSGALVMGFVTLYQNKIFRRYLDVMSPHGRMGLTNYQVQSIIGCFLFSMWAFGPIFGNWGETQVFILGLFIYIVQVIYSKYWLQYFLYGPLEWAWRSATYLKLQPFRRE